MSSVAGRPYSASKPLSLLPHFRKLRFLVRGRPLSSHLPKFPDLPFTSFHTSAVRYSASTTDNLHLSATISTKADIEDAAVPHPPAKNNRRRRQSRVRNFSLPTHHTNQPRTMSRYYASALTSDDRLALANGDKNHNLKGWTPKDLILHEEARKDLVPTNMYIGPGNQVCIIPKIVVTVGAHARTHAQQLFHKLHTQRSSSVPSLPPPDGPIARSRARARAHSRTSSHGSYFNTHHTPTYQPSGAHQHPSMSRPRVHSPLANETSSSEPQAKISFDSFLAPHRSGKGEVYRGGQNAKMKEAKKPLADTYEDEQSR